MQPEDTDISAHMTKDELPDGRGYRVMFADLDKVQPKQTGWPLDPFDPNYLSHIASITQDHLQLVAPEEPPFVYASKEGLDLLKAAGIEWVHDLFYNPSMWGKAEAGEDSKPLAVQKTVVGKQCVLKHLPWPKAASPSEEGSSPERHLNVAQAPDYLQRFGLTTRVAKVLRGTAERINTFQVEEPLVEYIASKDFKVDEYRPGINLHDLRRLVHIPEEPDEKYLGQTKRWWEHWFEQFEVEIAQLKDIFFIVGYEKGEPFSLASFGAQNWVCNGFDPGTSKPLLALVDQEAAPIGGMGSVLDMGDTARASQYQELVGRYNQDSLLIQLRA